MDPEKSAGRDIDPSFDDKELLYRRFPRKDGEPLATSIRFNEPPSFCRSKYSKPEDVLHPNCANGQDVANFGVFKIPVVAVRIVIENREANKKFGFEPKHIPLIDCYAHSELHCFQVSPIKSVCHSEPSRAIKNKFRSKIATSLTNCLNN